MSVDVSSIGLWFKKAVPNPSDKNKAVQIGVHIEEFVEMLEALGGKAEEINFLRHLSEGFKTAHSNNLVLRETIDCMIEEVDRKALLDSLCDQIVTAVGVAHMLGMDIHGALNEVNRSNWSKAVDGEFTFDANGKIMKPDTYSPPDLTPFV